MSQPLTLAAAIRAMSATRSYEMPFRRAEPCGLAPRGERQVEAISLLRVDACFLGKTIFKGLGLFETATRHDTISGLRVLTVGFEFRDPNTRGTGRQFP
jgi:hypothetical protein